MKHASFLLMLLILLPIFSAGCSLPYKTAPAASADDASSTRSTDIAATDMTTESTAAPAESTSAEKTAAAESPTPKPERSGTKFPDFSMKDLDGNTVDQTLFAGRDLTMVNMWGTFCPPCINEMPDLGKLAKVLESDYHSQLIGLVVDIGSEETLALAKDILDRSEAAHLNLIPDEAISEFIRQFEFVPTTFFIDKDGYILGQPVVGSRSYGDYMVLVKNLLGK